MTSQVLGQLRWRIKSHRLRIQQRASECGRLIALEPRRDIHQERKTGRMRFGKTIFAEAENLLIDLTSELLLVATRAHAVDQPLLKNLQSTFAFPRRHRTAQL